MGSSMSSIKGDCEVGVLRAKVLGVKSELLHGHTVKEGISTPYVTVLTKNPG